MLSPSGLKLLLYREEGSRRASCFHICSHFPPTGLNCDWGGCSSPPFPSPPLIFSPPLSPPLLSSQFLPSPLPSSPLFPSPPLPSFPILPFFPPLPSPPVLFFLSFSFLLSPKNSKSRSLEKFLQEGADSLLWSCLPEVLYFHSSWPYHLAIHWIFSSEYSHLHSWQFHVTILMSCHSRESLYFLSFEFQFSCLTVTSALCWVQKKLFSWLLIFVVLVRSDTPSCFCILNGSQKSIYSLLILTKITIIKRPNYIFSANNNEICALMAFHTREAAEWLQGIALETEPIGSSSSVSWFVNLNELLMLLFSFFSSINRIIIEMFLGLHGLTGLESFTVTWSVFHKHKLMGQ